MNQLWTEKERLLNIALDGLEKAYPRGLYDFLYVHDRALYTRIKEIEDMLNESFAEGGSVDEFKAMLRDYWRAHMEGIRAFKKSGQTSFDFAEVRAERIREREALAY